MEILRRVALGTALAGLSFPAASARAASYYVDPAGADSNDGKSEASAWATLANLSKVRSGDTVSFKSGGIWETTSSVRVNGATFQAYGTGARPLIRATAKGFGVISIQSNATVDGLMVQGVSGTAISIGGSGNVVRNCEVDGSGGALELGFGVMGENNLITGNYVHDLSGMTGDSGDMNTSGGSEAFMIMASNNEVSFNTAINCFGPNKTLGGEEGGCLEIVNGRGGSTITNVRFHHNYCETSVGLFEACSGDFSGQDDITKNPGFITDVVVAYNIAVDSKWMYLLQTVNTKFKNVVFHNNTIIHTQRNEDTWTKNSGHNTIGLFVNKDSVNNAEVPIDVEADQVIVRNNLFVEPFNTYGIFNGGGFSHSHNMFSPANIGIGKLTLGEGEFKTDETGLTADYRLTASSPAIDRATDPVYTEDIDHHAVPCGAGPDIGASEYCAGAGGSSGSGGHSGAPGSGGVAGTNRNDAGTVGADAGPDGVDAGAQRSANDAACSCQGGADSASFAGLALVVSVCAVAGRRARKVASAPTRRRSRH